MCRQPRGEHPDQPARAKHPAEEPPPPPVARIGGDREGWPAALADFAPWWLAEPALDPAPAGTRVPPRGVAGAQLLVLVTMPEAGDIEQLLSGKQGQLVSAMLRAMGIPPIAGITLRTLVALVRQREASRR